MRTFRDASPKKMNGWILICSMVILLISIIGSSLVYRWINNRLVFDSISKANKQTSIYVKSNIENVIDSINAYSKLIISNDSVQKTLDDNMGNLLDQQALLLHLNTLMESTPFISEIYLSDMEGALFSVYKDKSKEINPDYMDSSVFKKAVQDKGSYSIHLSNNDYFSSNSGTAFISFVRAIRDLNSHDIIGVLVINIPVDYLVSEQEDITDNQIRDLYIISDNEVVVHSGILDENPVSYQSVVGKAGYVSEKVHIGEDTFLVSSYWMEALDWYLISVISMNQTSGEIDDYNAATVILYIFNLVFIFLGVAIFSRFFVRPINRMICKMRANGENLEAIRLNSSIFELKQLEMEYNVMIDKIKALIRHRVNEQKSLRNKELELLQSQIKPHFLYNTLDTVKSLTKKGENEMAFEAVKALGKFYRSSLSKGEEAIPIAEEMAIVSNYLKIQNFRYKDIFELQMYLDPCLKELKVPRLILQPLVENALYHGIRPKGEMGVISVKAYKDGDVIKFIVEDDGVGFDTNILSDDHAKKSILNGFGLNNTIERLNIYYGSRVDVNIESTRGIGTKICIIIPEQVIVNPVDNDESIGGDLNA